GVGERLSQVNRVFQNLAAAETNDQLQAVSREVAPMLTAAQDDIRMNPALFARIRTVWEERERLALTPVQQKLLGDMYRSFVRGGASLDAEKQGRLRKVNAQIATLGVKFGDNLLHDTNAYRLVIERKADLAGLPDSVVAGAAEAAKVAELTGKWVFTLQAPSIWPFLQYAENRELRRQILQEYTSRCDHGDQYDNKAVVTGAAALRAERAALVGYKTFARFQLDEYMARTPERVNDLLAKVWTPARAAALADAAAFQEMIRSSGGSFRLEPWDWRYYAEKVRSARFSLDEQALRPYFKLDNIRDGAFFVATRLFGLTFTSRPDLPVYHPDVSAFEVKDADGSHLGVLYLDFHPRPGKSVGGWTDIFREHSVKAGKDIRPVAVIVCNFSRPAGAEPALLTIEEVETLFHEFGHALHVLLDRSPYRALSAFNVPSDFVELPSSIMENWALEPEVLKRFAMHFQTGEVIPADLIEKIKKARTFNQGFATVEYLGAAFLDMDWHALSGKAPDVPGLEASLLGRIRMPPQILLRYRSPYFSHVFGPGGGYAAGYYSYIWSEVLDADAFEVFKQKGVFDQPTAHAFRTSILEAGATAEAMTLYKRFRGQEPSVEPLLRRRGLK
ncbi:MAG: M3 family metallopeptidase, partial [Acidobacteria bacterium]|nr:M3 family metallopeptidase [Acidobacteriota bacterium]